MSSHRVEPTLLLSLAFKSRHPQQILILGIFSSRFQFLEALGIGDDAFLVVGLERIYLDFESFKALRPGFDFELDGAYFALGVSERLPFVKEMRGVEFGVELGGELG